MPARNTPLDEDIKKIVDLYNLGEFERIEHLEQAVGNSVFKLLTSKGNFLFKIFDFEDEDGVNFEIDVLEHLEANNIPVPHTHKTRNGERVITVNNRPSIVQSWIEGEIPERESLKFTKDLGDSLGRIHKVLESFAKKGRENWPMSNTLGVVYLNQKPLPEGLEVKRTEIESMLNKVDVEGLPIQVVHGDLYSHNVLVRDDKIVAILDWGNTHIDFRVADLATLLAVHGTDRRIWNHEKLSLILEGYEEHVKLLEKEKKVLYPFIMMRVMCNMLWCHQNSLDHPSQAERLQEFIESDLLLYETAPKVLRAWINTL